MVVVAGITVISPVIYIFRLDNRDGRAARIRSQGNKAVVAGVVAELEPRSHCVGNVCAVHGGAAVIEANADDLPGQLRIG